MIPLQDRNGRLLERFQSESANSTNRVAVTSIFETAKESFDAQPELEKNEYGALMSAVDESGDCLLYTSDAADE